MPAAAAAELASILPAELLENEIAPRVTDPEGLYILGQLNHAYHAAALRVLKRQDVRRLMATCFYRLVKAARDELVKAVAAGTYVGTRPLTTLPAFERLADWRRTVRKLPRARFVLNPPSPNEHGLALIPLDVLRGASVHEVQYVQSSFRREEPKRTNLRKWLRSTTSYEQQQTAPEGMGDDTDPQHATFQAIWYLYADSKHFMYLDTGEIYGLDYEDTVDTRFVKRFAGRVLAAWRSADWAGCAVTFLSDPMADILEQRAGLQALCMGLGVSLVDQPSFLGMMNRQPIRIMTYGVDPMADFYSGRAATLDKVTIADYVASGAFNRWRASDDPVLLALCARALDEPDDSDA